MAYSPVRSPECGEQSVICPRCRSEVTRRSMRRGVKDNFYALFGTRPWRCRTCNSRFFAWSVPVSFIFYVHCARCGSMDLQKVSRERVTSGLMLLLSKAFRLRAYRCDFCRIRFFSVRPFKRIAPTRVAASTAEASPAAVVIPPDPDGGST